MKVMFVCTGNTCRSVMAEGIFRELIKDKPNIEVYSCGIYAQKGESPMENAIKAVKEYGADIQSHKAVPVKEACIDKMDLILCATLGHKRILQQMYPEKETQIYTIKEYAWGSQENMDINDPYRNG